MKCASYYWITLTVCLPPLTHQKCSRPLVSDASCLTDINFRESGIIDAIKELSLNSAAGTDDGVLSSLLISCASEIAPLLRKLFTASFLKGYIPSSFKRDAIVPIFKSGDKCLPGNYS